MEILLATESQRSRAPQLSDARLLNFFVEKQEVESKGQMPLFGAPGIDAFSIAGGSPNRGSWLFNGNAYVVNGANLYRIDRAGNATQYGTGIDGTNIVGMSDNGIQLCIVNGVNGWIYEDVTNTFTQITDPAFYSADTVAFNDGYFIFDRKGTNQWFLSNAYDGLSYNALDFASAEAQPGFVIAVAQNMQLMFIFCTGHIEIWYDAGTSPFPYQRYAGGVLNFGTISPYSIVSQAGALYFLGNDHIYYQLVGTEIKRISTHAIEHLIEQDPDITLAEGTTYTIEGHKMVLLTLPASGVTLEYDISTGKWHDRDSVDANLQSLGRWRARTALAAYDDILLGDSVDGRVGKLNWNTYTEYGLPMLGRIRSANQHQDRHRVFCSRFELDMEVGVGLVSGQGDTPQIMLRRSIDGGRTFGFAQPWRTMGKLGEYGTRLRWLRQGQGRQMMWELEVSDPVPRTVIAAHADLSYGD